MNATSASKIIVLLKMPTKYQEFFLTLLVKTTDFQLVLILSRRIQLPFLESIVHTMMAKPVRDLELHYPMIHCLTITLIYLLF